MLLSKITLVVRDYDEAIAYFIGVLGFRLVENTDMGGGKRWVMVSPGEGSADILLAKGANEAQLARAGDQTGGRVAFFLDTDDFDRDHAALLARGVNFLEAPREEAYGKVAVFADIYGNKWDLVQPKA
ncbi:MAG TPA: extradiol dioxygenase [Hyphomonadaceae bacterium]|nr:extradiol dioxygenase [Hyphomonadaceae bacterium]